MHFHTAYMYTVATHAVLEPRSACRSDPCVRIAGSKPSVIFRQQLAGRTLEYREWQN